MEEQVLNYEVDFGFVVQSKFGHEDLQFEKVLDIPFWFIVHPSHPLANQTVPSMNYRTRTLFIGNVVARHSIYWSPFYTFNAPLPKLGLQMQGLHESIKVVEAGYGMTLAPSYSVDESIANGKLAQVYVEQAAIQQSLFICSRKPISWSNHFAILKTHLNALN